MAPRTRRAETRQARPLDRRARWKKTHPWTRLVEWARRRCNDRDSKWFQFYGAKGITCTLTTKELEPIWHRDQAHLLKRPSLDRIVGSLGYTKDNVRIIEFNANARMAWDESFKFLFNASDEERRAAIEPVVSGEVYE